MYIDCTVRHKFVLKSSLQIKEPEKQTFIIAPMPEMILPKGMVSESLHADILIDKYVYHLPFYRVMQKYKELGVLLSDSTIGDWFAAVCSKLRPLYDKLRERIMSSTTYRLMRVRCRLSTTRSTVPSRDTSGRSGKPCQVTFTSTMTWGHVAARLPENL